MRQLKRAPLARVLAQVRWPELANFSLDEVSERMGRRLGDAYPLVARQGELQVTITAAGLQQHESGYIVRFSSADENWNVSVGRSFLALDTSQYEGHDAFLERFRDVLGVLLDTASIPFVNRLGYRYTNRVVGDDDLENLEERFHPSVLGGLGVAPDGSELVHSITESVYRRDQSFLLVRSAQVGPNESTDPTLAAVDSKSWILDIDAYTEARVPAVPDEILKQSRALSATASEQFHSLVTEPFYERYA